MKAPFDRKLKEAIQDRTLEFDRRILLSRRSSNNTIKIGNDVYKVVPVESIMKTSKK
jgi:hypothetical protein